MEDKDKKEKHPMDIMGKTDMKSQIEFMESMNSYFISPIGVAIIASLKELLAIKQIRNSN